MTPKVFISYSWDNEQHKAWVKNLADRLFGQGIDVVLDQYEMEAGDDIPLFMERSIADTDKVLLILTEGYKTKADKRERGVGYEYSMINAEWYTQRADNKKFIPILRGKDATKSKPIFLNSIACLDMSDDAVFEERFKTLWHQIYGRKINEKPPVAQQPDFDDLHTTSAPTPTRIPVAQRIQQARNTQAQQKENRQLRKPRSERQDRDSQQVRQLRDLIAKGKTDTAIQQLRDLTDQVKDRDYQTQVIMQATAYEEYQKSKRMGITSHSEQQVSLAKINNALLELINEIP